MPVAMILTGVFSAVYSYFQLFLVLKIFVEIHLPLDILSKTPINERKMNRTTIIKSLPTRIKPLVRRMFAPKQPGWANLPMTDELERELLRIHRRP